MQKKREKAWFASLKNAKLLCGECKEVKRVKRYIGAGVIGLECGHGRSVQDTKLDDSKVRQVLDQLDDPEKLKEAAEEKRKEIQEIDNSTDHPWNQPWYDPNE